MNKYEKEQRGKRESFNIIPFSKQKILQMESDIFQNKLRGPFGLKYNSSPIVMFGCSYMYGAYLLENETLPYRLSHFLKTPIYNRAYHWGSLQEMWYQVGGEGRENFYQNVPKTDTYIYLMMFEHYDRMYSFLSAYSWRQQLNFINHKKELKNEIQRTSIESIIKASYTYRFLNALLIYHYLKNPKNKEEILNRAVLYLSNTKAKLEEYNGKEINFIVLLYDDILWDRELIEKLNKNGIITIRTKDLTKEDLSNQKYTVSKADLHPNAKAWELLTPLIAKEIERIWNSSKRERERLE